MSRADLKDKILQFAGWLMIGAAPGVTAGGQAATNAPAAIAWSEIGARAGADYNGGGLAVIPTKSGARLHCMFQRLDAEATAEGLWLISTVMTNVADRFQVKAVAIERGGLGIKSVERLAETGTVSVEGQTVRFSRPGLSEEYSVSMDGVSQDFEV